MSKEIEAAIEKFEFDCRMCEVNGLKYGCSICVKNLALSALRAQLERSNPKPLTLEELDVRDAPVYTPLSDGTGFWCLCQNGWIIPPSCMCFAARERREWTFYDHKPEEGDK